MTPQEAIEILKQIRKQKCVTECDYSCKLYESETFCLEEKALDTAIKALEQQPKTGRWIKVTNGRGGHECDLCHEYAPSYQSGKEYLTKYCPNCGAKMEVANDE